MNPAPSVILFSVLAGLGFGLLAFLSFTQTNGLAAFAWWTLAYGLTIAGLLSATFHLGNPRNALKAFSQWRTSWLSREAWAAVATLIALAPIALSDIFSLGLPRVAAIPGACLALYTVLTTGMIYTQIRAVPRWHQPTTPILFLLFAIAGGALLAAQPFAPLALILLTPLMIDHWRKGDGQFLRAAQTIGTATGLDRIGEVQVFEQPHTSPNYLMREMIYVVGRKHAQRLRQISVATASILPALILLLPGQPVTTAIAAALHLTGALAQRWLFFAEAEHVVGLYYGKR